MSDTLLDFDAEDHRYSIDGATLPSVTQIIGARWPITAPPEKLEYARQVGKAVHSATEYYDRGTLNWDSLDAVVSPFVESWMQFLKDTGAVVLLIEQQVHHPVLNFAGTLDRTIRCPWLNGSPVAILDLKKPKLTARVGVQTAGYLEAYNTLRKRAGSTWPMAQRRFGLQLRPGEATPYRLKEFTDKSDWGAFLACLTLYNFERNHEL